MCAVPNMAVFCSSFTSCFPGMLLTYFLNYFEIVPVAPIITGITFVIIIIIITIIIIINIIIIISCHRPFLPGTSLEPAVIPTAHASSFTLQYL